MHVLKKNKKIGGGSKNVNPTCLVLSPTRELAVQVYVFIGFDHYDYYVKRNIWLNFLVLCLFWWIGRFLMF